MDEKIRKKVLQDLKTYLFGTIQAIDPTVTSIADIEDSTIEEFISEQKDTFLNLVKPFF